MCLVALVSEAKLTRGAWVVQVFKAGRRGITHDDELSSGAVSSYRRQEIGGIDKRDFDRLSPSPFPAVDKPTASTMSTINAYRCLATVFPRCRESRKEIGGDGRHDSGFRPVRSWRIVPGITTRGTSVRYAAAALRITT